MNHFSRRQFIKGSAFAAGSIVISTNLSACVSQAQKHSRSQASFDHGVASGDPSSTSVIIWTRAQPIKNQGAATISWELAIDATLLTLFAVA